MSDPTGDAARDPVGGPAAAGAGATSDVLDASAAPAGIVVVGPVGLSAGTVAAGAVCPLLELAGDGRPGQRPPATDDGASSGEDEPGTAEVDMRPDPTNRCAASNPPAPISTSQQRFVCFDAGHADCPRFVLAMASPRSGGVRVGRAAPAAVETAVAAAAVVGAASIAAGAGSTGGASRSGGGTGGPQESGSPATPQAALSAEAPIPTAVGAGAGSAGAASTASDAGSPATAVTPVTPVTRSSRRSGARPAGRPTPTVVAAVILVVALGLTVAFVSFRGGLALPGASQSPVAVVSPSPSATVLESPSPSVAATPTPSPAPSPTPIVSPTPVVSPTPALTATPSLPAAYQGLKPCTDRPDCYLYRVRSGDNLSAIADRFGITLAALKAANREITDPSLLHVGDVIRVPLPKN